jgi:uncharacterized membrane protein (UPF0127 family)
MSRKKTKKPRISRNLVVAGLAVVALVIAVGAVIFSKNESTLNFGNRLITVEEVFSSSDKARGLSGRESILENQGMLFTYDEKGEHCIWMKGMNFPIDILWLDENKKVTQIAASVPPESFPSSFCPAEDAMYVLEVKSGLSRASGVDEGSQL